MYDALKWCPCQLESWKFRRFALFSYPKQSVLDDELERLHGAFIYPRAGASSFANKHLPLADSFRSWPVELDG